MLGRLRDLETAAAYLSAAAGEDDPGAFLQALRNVTEAMGGISEIAARTGLNRQQLNRTLSKGRQLRASEPDEDSRCLRAAVHRHGKTGKEAPPHQP